VASPLITQHTVHVGGSYMFADNWLLSVSYVHAFENEVSGPLQVAGSPIAGTAVASKVSADTLTAGFSKRF
jgi:long-subunit fatty acid transport protein